MGSITVLREEIGSVKNSFINVLIRYINKYINILIRPVPSRLDILELGAGFDEEGETYLVSFKLYW